MMVWLTVLPLVSAAWARSETNSGQAAAYLKDVNRQVRSTIPAVWAATTTSIRSGTSKHADLTH